MKEYNDEKLDENTDNINQTYNSNRNTTIQKQKNAKKNVVNFQQHIQFY